MSDSFFIYGASGHGRVLLDIAETLGLVVDCFIDENKSLTEYNGIPVFNKLDSLNKRGVIAIGCNNSRRNVDERLLRDDFLRLIHPRANVSSKVEIGDGTVVMAGATINAGVSIGRHVIVNTNSSIDHDCEISDFVHISPNVALCGNVIVGEGSHIGVGACIIPGIKIGKWAVIGAGTVVIKDVPDNVVVVGNPGQIIKSIK
jgi:sugar O-acyltransferase (sialic acid O-acetyltransferase NeuD family)